MPAGKRWSKTLHQWVKKAEPRPVDYSQQDEDSWALILSYFRWYPDRLLELCQDEDADFNQQFIQCLIWRVDARYKETFVTGTRGLSKTFTKVAGTSAEMLLWPKEKIRYFGPTMNQAADLAKAAYEQVAKNYPVLSNQLVVKTSNEGEFWLIGETGSEFRVTVKRGDNCHHIICEECGQEDEYPFDHERYQTVVDPTNRLRHMVNNRADPTHVDFKKQYTLGPDGLLNASQRPITDSMPTQGSSNPVQSGGVYSALSNKADKFEKIVWTLSSPSDLTTPGRIGVAYMTDQVNTNVTDGKIMTDYSAGDFHCILLASNFSDLGCEFGVLIVTSPRLPGTVWVGQIWEYKFNAWYKMPTATPPQEYDMSLSEGATGTCKYSMDQFGIVRITGQISLSAATGITYIGTLPEGYRPGSYEVKSTCGWQTGGVNPVPCTCGADPDGRVWVNSYGAATDAAAIDIRFVNSLS